MLPRGGMILPGQNAQHAQLTAWQPWPCCDLLGHDLGVGTDDTGVTTGCSVSCLSTKLSRQEPGQAPTLLLCNKGVCPMMMLVKQLEGDFLRAGSTGHISQNQNVGEGSVKCQLPGKEQDVREKRSFSASVDSETLLLCSDQQLHSRSWDPHRGAQRLEKLQSAWIRQPVAGVMGQR